MTTSKEIGKEYDIFTPVMKLAAINFATWLEDNGWTVLYSEKLSKRSYVNESKGILIHGSDHHYTKLIKVHGKELDELFELFLIDERKRISNEKLRHKSGE